jgi:outer membrane protein
MVAKKAMKQGTTLITLCSLNLIGLLVFAVFQFFSPSEIVYVDSIKILSGYKGMEYAKKEFDTKVAIWNSNLDTLKMEMEEKFNEYDSKRLSLSSKEKELMEELLETKRAQYLNYQQMIAEKVKKEDQELTTKVYAKVNDYLKRYGEQKKYAFILGANQYGSIVYAENAVNITDEVLEGLNQEFSK